MSCKREIAGLVLSANFSSNPFLALVLSVFNFVSSQATTFYKGFGRVECVQDKAHLLSIILNLAVE